MVRGNTGRKLAMKVRVEFGKKGQDLDDGWKALRNCLKNYGTPKTDWRPGEEGETDEIEEEYDCVEILQHLDEAARAAEELLQNLGLVLFTDGSSFVEKDIQKGSWAVTALHEVMQGSLPAGISA
ncbi:hypothetical protein chiPu_0011859 [Chiloscyllium punctatum]|uniref:Uncharacterized protein n=1 Tax=Chiloscyllium punctatum TaxID=137246 RepID=A0A401SSM3_CHIPU|nr:hypothetical protein [Chiloscyllium punctatum]